MNVQVAVRPIRWMWVEMWKKGIEGRLIFQFLSSTSGRYRRVDSAGLEETHDGKGLKSLCYHLVLILFLKFIWCLTKSNLNTDILEYNYLGFCRSS